MLFTQDNDAMPLICGSNLVGLSQPCEPRSKFNEVFASVTQQFEWLQNFIVANNNTKEAKS